MDKKHKALEAFINIPKGYSADDVDLSTIILNNKIKPINSYKLDLTKIGICGLQINDVFLSFSGADLSTVLVTGDNTLTVTGKIGNAEFEATGKVNCFRK